MVSSQAETVMYVHAFSIQAYLDSEDSTGDVGFILSQRFHLHVVQLSSKSARQNNLS